MTFQFPAGGGTPAPAPTPGGGSGGSLGTSTTTNTPSSNTNPPAAPAAPTGGGAPFNSTPTPAAGGTTTNPVLGSAPAAAPTTTPTGFFSAGGGGSSNVPPPTTAGGTSNIFGNPPTLAAPTTPAAGLGGSAPSSGTAPFGVPAGPTGNVGAPPVFRAPRYKEVFPGHVVWDTVRPLVDKAIHNDSEAGKELLEILSPDKSFGSILLKSVEIWKWQKTPDHNLRNQLRQASVVDLWGDGTLASLDQVRRDQIFQVSDELHLPEGEALALLAHAGRKFPSSPDIIGTARDVYFTERSQFLKTLLYLIQNRQGATDGSLFMQATDALLQKGLVTSLLEQIQTYSSRIDTLSERLTPYKPELFRSHWQFGIQERLRASECLLFTAYHTQLEVAEIVALIDTVQTITNPSPGQYRGMPVADPFQDAPSAFEESSHHYMSAHSSWNPAAPPRKEKKREDWRKELVENRRLSCQNDLLRCVSILLSAGIAAFDTTLHLVSRHSHGRNPFGRGNTLIPQDSSGSLDHLIPIDAKLNLDAASKWHRKDVFGLLFAAYGLLLRSAPPSLISPRNGTPGLTQSAMSPDNVKRRCMDALDNPTQWKSFTFGRLCLVPGVAIPPNGNSFQKCDSETYALDVLTGLMARYLDTISTKALVSRNGWLADAQEHLRIQQQVESQNRQFQQEFKTNRQQETVPSSVNILDRPDCMDDILAFCVTIGLKGPAVAFWTLSPGLRLSDATLHIDRIDDSTLRGPYFNFLAMLATAKLQDNAADKLHSVLSGTESPDSDFLTVQWADIVDIIRYYARLLIDSDSFQSSTQTSSTAGRQSTAYYYLNEDGMAARNSSSSTKASSASKTRLDADGEYLIGACLHLLEAVAARSSNARSYLRGLSLPVTSSDHIVGEDSTINILFALAMAPVTPEIRGLLFTTIGTILNDCALEEALNMWNIVESNGFLPIYKFLQFPTDNKENDIAKISYPASLTAQVREKPGNSPIPADAKFSIIYEMEYIETIEACYPSTAGFLALLTSLVRNGGCPSNLGQNSRPRTGCSPYIEYAMDYVLPRALGTFGNFPALPFSSSAEKNRLCGAALELIETVLASYVIPHQTAAVGPSLTDSLSSAKKAASLTFRLKPVADSTVIAPKDQDFAAIAQDFPLGLSASRGLQETSLPPPKTPGFSVLFRAFHNDRNSLCSTLVELLSTGDVRYPTEDADELQLSMAVFGRVQPSFDTSRRDNRPTLSKLLVNLKAEGRRNLLNAHEFRQSTLSSILRIFCILASREEAFYQALKTSNLDQMVPMLRFNTTSGSPIRWELDFSRLSATIETDKVIDGIVAAISRFDEQCVVPSFAVALLFLVKNAQGLPRFSEAASRALGSLFSHLHEMQRLSFVGYPLFAFALDCLRLEMKENRQPSSLIVSLVVQPILESLGSAVSSLDYSVDKNAEVASRCFEIIVLIHRMHAVQNPPQSFYFESLEKLELYVGPGNRSMEILNSAAWVLQGIGDHLVRSTSNFSSAFSRPNSQIDEAFRNLLEGRKHLLHWFQLLPGDTAAVTLSCSLHYCLGASILVASRTNIVLPLGELVLAFLDKLRQDLDVSTLRNVALSLYVSVDHTILPVNTTLEVATEVYDCIERVPASNAILVATLVLILSRLDTDVSGEISDKVNTMLASRISPTLLEMACQVTDAFPPAPTSEAITARAALKLLFSHASAETIHRWLRSSSPRVSENRSFIERFIGLLAHLDHDIPSLLAMIGWLPNGGRLLLEARVLEALRDAANRFNSLVESQKWSFPAMSIVSPSFFLDNLQLINGVFVNGVQEELKWRAANQVLQLLTVYDPFIANLLSGFPLNGDIVVEYFRCLVALQSMTQGVFHYPNRQSDLRTLIPQLIFQLLEHPIPKDYRGPMPSLLMQSHDQTVHGLVRTAPNSKTWWEILSTQNLAELGHADICFHGMNAAEIALCGLRYIVHAESIPSIDTVTLGRSLVASVDTITYLDRCTPTPTEVQQSFRKRVIWIIMELLRVFFSVAQQISNGDRILTVSGAVQVGNPKASLLAALDHAKLHTLTNSVAQGTDPMTAEALDELTKKVYDCLRGPVYR